MPLDLTAKWSAAPLGQLSRLVLGRDSGWRGSFDFQARVTGTAAMAEVKTLLRVDSLHRSEFTPPHPVDLVATCNASYRKAASSLKNIACSSHPGGGDLSLTGSIVHMRNGPETALSLRVRDVPASAVLAGLQEVRQGFGGGVRALGELNGKLQYTSAGSSTPALSGEVGFESLSLLPGSGRPFLLAPVRFRFENPGNGGLRGTMFSSAPETAAQISPTLLLEPVRLSLGSPSPLVVDGRFTPDGFAVHVGGTTTLAHLKPLSWILARPMPNSVSAMATSSFAPEGTATLDLSVLGPWVLPFSDPDNPVPHMVVAGSVAVKNAQLTTSYLSRPLKIASATAILTPSAIAWTNASIAYGAIEAQGSLEYATSCAAEEPCPARFAVTGSSWSLADLQSSFVSSGQHDELLREFLNRIDGSHAAWPTLSGTVQVESLSAGKLVAHDVAATLDIAGNAMRIRSFTGRVLKGSVHLNGMVDASGNAPAYDLALQVTNASAAQLAGLFDEHWGSGQASFSSQLTMKGFSAADLAGSARGTLHWDWKDGALEAADSTGDGTEPLMVFSDWHGDGTIGDSTIRTAHSTMIEESGRHARFRNHLLQPRTQSQVRHRDAHHDPCGQFGASAHGRPSQRNRRTPRPVTTSVWISHSSCSSTCGSVISAQHDKNRHAALGMTVLATLREKSGFTFAGQLSSGSGGQIDPEPAACIRPPLPHRESRAHQHFPGAAVRKFVTVLSVNRFAGREMYFEIERSNPHSLVDLAFEMHLDAREARIPNRVMAKELRMKVRIELAIDAAQDVPVKFRRHSGGVIVRGEQQVRIFHHVDAEQQPVAGGQRGANLGQ